MAGLLSQSVPPHKANYPSKRQGRGVTTALAQLLLQSGAMFAFYNSKLNNVIKRLYYTALVTLDIPITPYQGTALNPQMMFNLFEFHKGSSTV